MTCCPAPIAKSDSVAVAESETMRLGAAAGEPDAADSATTSATRSPRKSLDTNPPSARGSMVYAAGGRSSDSGLPFRSPIDWSLTWAGDVLLEAALDLGAGRPLGRADLRPVVGAEPRHRS